MKTTLRLVIPSLAAAVTLVAATTRAAEPPKKTPALVEQGKAAFATNCAACHGERGEGDGVAAATLTPRPRNLVVDPLKHGAKAPQLFQTISTGVPGTAMVGFSHLSEQERWGLAWFVEDLRGTGKAKKK